MIARHNDVMPAPGPSNVFLAVTKRLTLQGFIITDHDDLAGEFRDRMRTWIAEGRIRWRETIFEGLEQAPEALLGLFHGANIGKMLVRLEA
jgi:NADPH-dependent curcumin reductase CurA